LLSSATAATKMKGVAEKFSISLESERYGGEVYKKTLK
jgi:hypothetical protein